MGIFKNRPNLIQNQIIKRTGYSPEQLTKMAEEHINIRVNEIAQFIENKGWTGYDTYIAFNIIIENDIKPKLTEKEKETLKNTMDSLTIKKEGE